MAKDPYQLGSINFKNNLGGMRNKAVEKPKDFKGAFLRLVHYAKRRRRMIIGSAVAAIAGAIFSLLGPGSLSSITDLISEGMQTGAFNFDAIRSAGIFLTACYLLSFALTYGQSFLMVSAAQAMGRQMRNDISSKVNRIPLSAFGSSSFGDLISRTTNDVETIVDALQMALPDIVSAIVLFIGSSIFMFQTNVTLALTAIITSLAGFLLIRRIIASSQKYFQGTSYYLGAIDGHIEEIYAAHLLVKT
ncbi:MAG TPA: ABC transporter, partial [Erysipelotrichaceae bacterium]|nr:ABC transporter [Erysipelotrichaceae bacterium]